MKIPFIHLCITFFYLVASTSAIPVTPSNNHPLAGQESHAHHDLQILFVSGTPADKSLLNMDQIERGSRDKKNLLVSSDLIATNQMLEGLLARLDDSIILEGRWYENSMRVIASGIDLISQLEKQPSNDLDSNIRILITNFLIYLESAIETVALQISPFAKTRMLPYFEPKLQIFINFTESRPKARLTLEEMDAKLEEVYKDRFKTPSELRLHINRVRGVLVKVKKTTSMTWEFRTLEVAHLIAQWSRWPSVALAGPNTNSVLGFYIVYIAAVLKKLNKRHMEKSDVGPVGGTCRREDGEQLKGFLERLKEELEMQMQRRKFLTAVGSGSESARRKRPLEPDRELEPSDLPVNTFQLAHRPKKTKRS